MSIRSEIAKNFQRNTSKKRDNYTSLKKKRGNVDFFIKLFKVFPNIFTT